MEKAIPLTQVVKLRNALPAHKMVVLATGAFDIVHAEHKKFLKKAKEVGDVLVVGVETDARVREAKGEGRPMNLQRQRQKTIATEQAVSYAFILPENLSTKSGREELIRALRPDFYAVSENTPHLKEKRRIMKKFGGKLRVVHRYNPQVSSTKIITNQRLVHRRKKPTNI